MINITEDDDLLSKGLAREVTNRVQKLRKQVGYLPTTRFNFSGKIDGS